MNATTRIYISVVIALGLATVGVASATWESANFPRFFTYLVLACLSGGLKIRMPGVTATQSGAFLIVLLSIAVLSTPETVAVAVIAAIVQYAWQSKIKLKLMQAAFNASNVGIAAYLASLVIHSRFLFDLGFQHPLRLAFASVVYFALTCVVVSIVISLTDVEKRSFRQVINDYYLWSTPLYVFGAGLTEGIRLLERYFGWQIAILVVPAVYSFYQVWAVYADRVEGERKRQEEARIHAEEMSALHVRTIHALAMAIEARDRTTHDHLRRVQIYAVELGRDIGMNHAELEALRTAAVLHDVGKLAVPEHIIGKPGRLTREEFQKVQAHPVVGADILERVNFPYAVVPIVRSHHERWDGSGYPNGLKGEDIPLGARILSVVDVFDALSSDRQYRKAMSKDQAMDIVSRSAGKEFDPRVVDILKRRYSELEVLVRAAAEAEPPMLSRQEIRAAVPSAGFQTTLISSGRDYDVSLLIRSASAPLHRALRREDLSSVLAACDRPLRASIDYELLAVSLREGVEIRLLYLTGIEICPEECLIGLGHGLTGWVVEEGRPILNGNGRLDSLVQAHTGRSDFLSGSSVPIMAGDQTIGAVTVYAAQMDAFATRDMQAVWGFANEIGAWFIDALAREKTAAANAEHSLAEEGTTEVHTKSK
ncbi:MAG: HD domain-containing protein [Bryobacteraceae bacterium]|nr:HD domain-containing protein [Bryobacteraceae bacterium]